MTEVYVVTCGSYYDYSIVAIYSDRAAADQRVAGESSYHPSYREEYRVEVYTLNEMPVFAGVVWHSAWWATETVLSERDQPAAVYKIWYEGDDPGNATATEGVEDGNRYVKVVGHSKEHVQKSADDRRQRIRAELLGIA